MKTTQEYLDVAIIGLMDVKRHIEHEHGRNRAMDYSTAWNVANDTLRELESVNRFKKP